MQTNILSGGFADAAIQSAHAFRSVMEAMARPRHNSKPRRSITAQPAFARCGCGAPDALRYRNTLCI